MFNLVTRVKNADVKEAERAKAPNASSHCVWTAYTWPLTLRVPYTTINGRP